MDRKTLTIAMVMIAALLAGSALAQPCGRMGPKGGGPALERIADEIELTDEQLEEIENIRYESELESVDMHAELKKEEIELRHLMDFEDFSRQEIMAQAEKVGEMKQELQLNKMDARLRSLEVLTDEQREKMKDLRRESTREGIKKMHSDGGKGCPGHQLKKSMKHPK